MNATPGSAGAKEYRAQPCPECPWRRDADLARFSDTDMDRLKRSCAGSTAGDYGPADVPAMRTAPAMLCHRDQPGSRHAGRLCAGWLVVAGPDHLQVRILLAIGRLPHRALEAGTGWPRLYTNLEELLAARERSQT